MPIPPELVGPIQTYFGPFSHAVVEFRPLWHLSINNPSMEIFQIRDSLDHIHMLLGVRCRTPAPPNLSGPFQRHPVLQMKLYGAAFGPLEVISPQFVSGHVAFLPLRVQQNEVVATISMSCVSPIFHSFSTRSYMKCRLRFFVVFMSMIHFIFTIHFSEVSL